MDPADIERIARVVVRDYGLPVKVDAVSLAEAGRCTVTFADPSSGAVTITVGVWCDTKASPYGVRELLKKGLQITA